MSADFAWALRQMTEERRAVTRAAWPEGQSVSVVEMRDGPRCRMRNTHGNASPWSWTPTSDDLFANDWRLA
jgi:hypothetical protein